MRTQIQSILPAVLLASFGLGGCRFGNQVKNAPPPPDPFEFFETQPERMTLCVATSTQPETVCNDTSPNPVPSLLAQFMGNPIGVRIDATRTTGPVATLFDPFYPGDRKPGFPMNYDPTSAGLAFSGYENPSPLLDDEACTSQFFLTAEGKIERAEKRSSESGLPISGRMTMDYQMYSVFEGDCENTLTLLHACYFKAEACDRGSDSENLKLQNAIQQMFEPYLAAGVMTVDDIRVISGLGYQFSYE